VVVVDGERVLRDQRAVRVGFHLVLVRVRRPLHLEKPGERHHEPDGAAGLELPVQEVVVVAGRHHHPHHQGHVRPDLRDLRRKMSS
jgi:hypothetical protein